MPPRRPSTSASSTSLFLRCLFSTAAKPAFRRPTTNTTTKRPNSCTDDAEEAPFTSRHKPKKYDQQNSTQIKPQTKALKATGEAQQITAKANTEGTELRESAETKFFAYCETPSFNVPLVKKLKSKTTNYVDKFFRKSCEFVTASADGEGPKNLPSVAFLGRSNVGKSSLINALIGQSKVVKTSSKPGHTRTINFFSLNRKVYLVDMPGFGHRSQTDWGTAIMKYLTNSSLKRAFVLIDSRRGVGEIDEMAIRLLLDSEVPYQIVLTKIDKLTDPEELRNCQLKTFQHVLRLEYAMNSNRRRTPAIAPLVSVSSQSKLGLSDLRFAALLDCGVMDEKNAYSSVQDTE